VCGADARARRQDARAEQKTEKKRKNVSRQDAGQNLIRGI
jgi:hypothetical protein